MSERCAMSRMRVSGVDAVNSALNEGSLRRHVHGEATLHVWLELSEQQVRTVVAFTNPTESGSMRRCMRACMHACMHVYLSQHILARADSPGMHGNGRAARAMPCGPVPTMPCYMDQGNPLSCTCHA